MTTKLFEFLRQNSFLSVVQKRIDSTRYNDKAILLMNRFGVHYSDKSLHKYSEVNIEVLFFALIGTNIHFPPSLVTDSMARGIVMAEDIYISLISIISYIDL
jgi:hypothetical protein